MKKHFKPIVLLIAAAVLTTGLSGCKTGKSVSKSADKPMEITWGINFSCEGVFENTGVQKWLEEKFNIKIKPVKVTNVSVASGEIPDIFTLADPSNVNAYFNQNVLLDFDESIIKDKLPLYYEDISSVDKSLFDMVRYNDKLYAIPMFVEFRPYDFAMLWRADWLEKLGFDRPPETLDQFEKAIYAIAKQDPDGNGNNDTFGLTGTMTTTWASGFYSIFGAFGVEPNMWFVRDGKVVNGSVLPEAKNALATLNKWHTDGVLDPEFITDTQEAYRKKFYNGKIGVIEETVVRGALDSSSTILELKAVNGDAKAVMSKNPAGPGGEGSWGWGNKSNFVVFGSQIKNQHEKLEKLFEIVRENTINREMAYMVQFGERGTHWDTVESGANAGPVKFIGGFTNETARQQAGIELFSLGNITTKDLRKTYEDSNLVDAIKRYSSGNNWTDALNFASLPSDDTFKKNLTTLMQQYYAEIILGTRPLDDFERFVSEWNSRGGDILTKEANEYYQERLAANSN